MPKLTKDIEDQIIELIEQNLNDSEISREIGVHRTTVAKRREAYLKRKANQTKPEKGPETNIQHEHTDSHPLDSQIYTLIRYQGTHSREEALSQAIETQNSFNPYILNHGLKSPKELIKFFEDESQHERKLGKDLILDKKISQSLIVTYQETITELKQLADKQYDEGYDQGEIDHAIYVKCVYCGEPYQVTPQSEVHGVVTQTLLEHGWGHDSCVNRA